MTNAKPFVAAPMSNQQILNAILRWRWAIVALSAIVALLVEGLEETLLLKIDHIEVMIYGLALPIFTWALLTILARAIAKRAASEAQLDRHQWLARQLEMHQSWDELAKFVTQFPGTLLPVCQTSLYLYDHPTAQLKFVTRWDAIQGWQTSPDQAATHERTCEVCLATKSPHTRHTAACAVAFGLQVDAATHEYCQPLVYDGLMIGILRLRLIPDDQADPDRLAFLDAVASKIALALALAIAQPQQMNQVRRVAQLDERRRIAYELHDSLAQQIGYLHLALDRLSLDERLPDDNVRQELRELRDTTGEAYQHIRDNLTLLRSSTNLDLTLTVSSYARAFAHRHHLNLDFTTEGVPPAVTPTVYQHGFSLVQESLNNISKHAKAQRFQIAMKWINDVLILVVSDDGVGFDPLEVPAGHYGLSMMRERVEALGGTLLINSAAGQGTRLTLRLPLRASPLRLPTNWTWSSQPLVEPQP